MAPQLIDPPSLFNSLQLPSDGPSYPVYSKGSEPKTTADFLRRAREVGDLLATDVAARDHANEIPYKQVQLLKDSGLLTALGPTEYGGGGQPFEIGYKVRQALSILPWFATNHRLLFRSFNALWQLVMAPLVSSSLTTTCGATLPTLSDHPNRVRQRLSATRKDVSSSEAPSTLEIPTWSSPSLQTANPSFSTVARLSVPVAKSPT